MVQSVMPSITGPFVLGGGSSGAGDRESGDGGGNRGGGRNSSVSRPMSNEECGIREVWAHNMEEEFHHIRRIVHQYPYVAMVSAGAAVVHWVHTHTHPHTCACLHTHPHTFAHTHSYASTHTYTLAHSYTLMYT